MNKVLSLKAWQLFAMLVLPVFLNSLVVFEFWFIIFMGWLFILGTNLFARLPAGEKPSLIFFRFNCGFALSYLLVISTIFPNGFTVSNENINEFGKMGYIILPLHFYAIYSLLYAIYFISKSLKSIEKAAMVPFDGYFGYFIMLWFFPIGIWWLQPKIKNIFGDNAKT